MSSGPLLERRVCPQPPDQSSRRAEFTDSSLIRSWRDKDPAAPGGAEGRPRCDQWL